MLDNCIAWLEEGKARASRGLLHLLLTFCAPRVSVDSWMAFTLTAPGPGALPSVLPLIFSSYGTKCGILSNS